MRHALLFGMLLPSPALALGESLDAWIQRFQLHPPPAAGDVADRPSGDCPTLTVTPSQLGAQTVRQSVPFPPGALAARLGLEVTVHGQRIPADLRVLTYHPGTPRWVRRALVTFPYTFETLDPLQVTLHPVVPAVPASTPQSVPGAFEWSGPNASLLLDAGGVQVRTAAGATWSAVTRAPALSGAPAPVTEILENSPSFVWVRQFHPDPDWPKIVEVQADATGAVLVRLHLQRLTGDGEYAPEFGWQCTGWATTAGETLPHNFAEGQPLTIDGPLQLRFPEAPFQRKGIVTRAGDGALLYRRSTGEDKLPMQRAAWRTATLVVYPKDAPDPGADFRYGQAVRIAANAYDALYPGQALPDITPWPYLEELLQKHRDGIATATPVGDDWGNVSGVPTSGIFSMNRLNHCPPVFAEYWRTGDARLRDVALRWCDNFYDLSIWWGEDRPGEFGGTRYNNRAASGKDAPPADPAFMWRTDTAVHFCTKGYDSFFYAYEETGDPRFATALHWQTQYAAAMVHTDQGECRNIGDVLDFVRLYEHTGDPAHLEQALRLFRELRTKVGPDHLFSQGGQPIVPDEHFMDSDDVGYLHPFAKPYIIGYALAGLPLLARYAPEEPGLVEVIRAVANFLATSQDPTGGWRYPHPRSSRVLIGQGMEHAAQIARAADFLHARGEDITPLLDAIERVLQARLGGYQRGNGVLDSLDGWERSTGAVDPAVSLHERYKHPDERDRTRDYTEGTVGLGGTSPEGAVYVFEVLAFYLQHRPAERLLNATPELRQVLDRVAPAPAPVADATYPPHGVEKLLPTFAAQRLAAMDFPMAWRPDSGEDFAAWRARARAFLLASYGTPPTRAPFDPVVTATEDRGSYEARKLVLNISNECRIPAYLLVPKGTGPFPAVLALHDHGAHFSIGKEKMVRPFGVEAAVLEDATAWAAECYGGRFIGDELAARGFVVLAIDALYWGERGRNDGPAYEEQQSLAANLLQLGMTWSGVITWDDLRSAEFLASLPEVDPARIGAVGLSMGAHRTWTLCAATDRIKAGAAICWLGDSNTLMAPGNNQTRGQSAHAMLAPGLRNALDYPHVAAIACPKPMLFFNGTDDPLFPVPGVEAAYAILRQTWDSQGVGEKLTTKLWPVPHVFNEAMQSEAFDWLTKQL